MSTEHLKNLVIDQISQIEDENFLNAVKTILDTNLASGGSVMMLTVQQKEKIQNGLHQLATGKTTTNEELEKDENEWLKE
jgi:hypothetical protein